MPYIKITTNIKITDDREKILREELGEAITVIPGKSEAWLIVRGRIIRRGILMERFRKKAKRRMSYRRE